MDEFIFSVLHTRIGAHIVASWSEASFTIDCNCIHSQLYLSLSLYYVYIVVLSTINDNDMLSYSLTTMMCFLTKEWYGFPSCTVNLFIKAYHKITYKEELKLHKSDVFLRWYAFLCGFGSDVLFTIDHLRSISLRVRAFFHKTVQVCHVYCNFKIGFTCRINVIFGTLKDGSLLINTLASNICFSYRNMFQNGVDVLSKIVDAFLSKSSKFHLVRIIR